MDIPNTPEDLLTQSAMRTPEALDACKQTVLDHLDRSGVRSQQMLLLDILIAGTIVATLDWVLREYQPGYRVLIVEFTAADIACIPTATDGKFRLHRCTVVGEKDVSALVQQPSAV